MSERLPIDRTVLRTDLFDIHQDWSVPLPGFFVMEQLRHSFSIADFTADEQSEFMGLITKLRRGMKEVLGVEHVYFFQNEDSRHGYHLWVFPRYDWMERFGRKIQSVRPIMNYAKEHMWTEETFAACQDYVLKMRSYMAQP